MITQELFIGDKVVDSKGNEFFRGGDYKWQYPIKLFEAPADWAVLDSLVEIKGDYKLVATVHDDNEFNATQINRW